MPRPHPSAWRWWWVAGLFVLVLAGRLSAASDGVRIKGNDYVSAVALGRQTGLKPQWDSARKVLALVGPAVRIEFEVDSREVRINELRAFLGEAAVLHQKAVFISRIDRDRFLLPIFNPRRLPAPLPKVRTVAIDPGHGGKDDGARNSRSGLLEKTVTLDVAKRVGAKLTAAGFRVVYTRNTDTFLALPDRPALAVQEKADLFVSIHFNAIDNPSISGNETYILTPQSQRSTGSDRNGDDDAVLLPGNAVDELNAILGYRMHLSVAKAMRGADRGLKRARFAVLRDLRCPGVLVEGGYLTNEAEARKIAKAEWRDQLATAIVAGVVLYREAFETVAKK